MMGFVRRWRAAALAAFVLGLLFGVGAAVRANLAVIGFQQPLSHSYLNSLVQSTDLITDLRNFVGGTVPSSDSGVTGSVVYVFGAASAGDGGAGLYYWNATSSATDDGFNVIKPTAVVSGGRWLRTPMGGQATVLTNTQLGLLKSGWYSAVLRLGVNAAGDAPAQWFIPSATACTISGGDVGSEVPTADGGCMNAIPAAVGINPREFGAVGNGTLSGATGTDDAAALQRWFNYGAAGNRLSIPCATFMFATPLSTSAIPVSIKGGGSQCSNLRYFGISTTPDLISLGSTSAITWNATMSGFRVSSATHMTAGRGLVLIGMGHGRLVDVSMTTQNGDTFPGNLWNGLALVHSSFDYGYFDDTAQNDVIECQAAAGETTVTSVDIRLGASGKVSGGAIGIHLGGGCGGFTIGQTTDVVANGQNVVIDNTLNGLAPNSEVFIYGPLDTPTTDNIVVNNTLASGGQDYTFAGWVASAPRYGIDLKSCASCLFHIPYGTILGNAQDGIRIEDNTIQTVDIGVPLIYSNGATSGFGVDCTVSFYIARMSSLPYNNSAGHNINATNCHSGISWTPTLSFATGSGWTYSTQVGSYQVTGGVATINFYVALSGIGTASGLAKLNLPITCSANSPTIRGNAGGVSAWSGMTGVASTIGLGADNAAAATFNVPNGGSTGNTGLTASNFTASSIVEGQLSCPIY